MKKLLFLVVLWLGAAPLKAQNSLSMITNEPAYWFPASVTLGDSVSFAVKIKNNMPTSFYDTLYLQVAVDTGAIIPTLINVHSEFLFVDSIDALDTVIRAINNVPINPNVFQEGNNTVVIWPVYPNPGGPPSDSLFNDTYAYLGLHEPQTFTYPMAYPNPCSDIVQFTRLIYPIEEVRITNAEGREVAVKKQVTHIDMKSYPRGVYYLQYMHRDRLITSRIVKL